MDIDIYQQCPCLSGKKIKFCCGKTVVNELNQVLSKSGAGQTRSALDLIEHTIEKHGPLDCMLTIQTHLLISEGMVEEAQKVNDVFREKNPDHTTGLHHQALIHLSNRDVPAAIDSLQDAMDSITGNEIPISLSNAFRMIGVGMMATGQVVGARAHLQYAQLLKDDADPELQQLQYQTFRMPDVSLLLKQDFRLNACEEGVEWEKRYTNTVRALDRGQFRKGLEFLNKIQSKHPDQPEVLRGIAILHLYLGQLEEAGKAWHAYSLSPEIREWDAIEAAALAQMFTPEPMSKLIDVMRCTFEVEDMDTVSETALSSKLLVDAGAVEADPFQEGPAPRHVFYLLDKEELGSPDDLSLENVPSVRGELFMFGKQTDRPARIEWVAAKGPGFDASKARLERVFAQQIQGDAKEAKLGETTEVADLMNWNWHLPKGVTREQHSEMVDARREQVLVEEWADLKFAPLGHKSPNEVKGDENYKTALNALVLHLEQSDSGQLKEDTAIAKLREKLGLGILPTVDPEEAGEMITPIQQQYLDFTKLTDDQLLMTQQEAMAIGNVRVMKQAVPEVLNRESLNDRVPKDVSYSLMAQMTDDADQALEYLAKARAESKSAGRSVGVLMVQEFELRLMHGMTEKLPELLATIQRNYLDDPQVERQLAMVLQKFGLMDETGRMVGPPPQAAPVGAAAQGGGASEGGIWTPDGGSGPADEGESGGSGLYIPD